MRSPGRMVRPLAFAGVWERWKAPDGRLLRTFAILTTSANATMRQLHERMPVILEPDDWAAWLENAAQAMDLMRPAKEDVLRLWPVSRAVNSVRNNGAELAGPGGRSERTAAERCAGGSEPSVISWDAVKCAPAGPGCPYRRVST